MPVEEHFPKQIVGPQKQREGPRVQPMRGDHHKRGATQHLVALPELPAIAFQPYLTTMSLCTSSHMSRPPLDST